MFLLVMAAGSIVGTFIGGQLLGLVPKYILLPVLAALLLLSAIRSGGTNNKRGQRLLFQIADLLAKLRFHFADHLSGRAVAKLFCQRAAPLRLRRGSQAMPL